MLILNFSSMCTYLCNDVLNWDASCRMRLISDQIQFYKCNILCPVEAIGKF